jgi:hypothetical protein
VGWPIRGQQDAKPPDEVSCIGALRRLERELAPLDAVVMHGRQDGIPLLLRGAGELANVNIAGGLSERRRQIESSQLLHAALIDGPALLRIVGQQKPCMAS